MPTSYTERTLARLRKDDRWPLVQVVEKWVPFPSPGHRVDLFGVIDILAVGPAGTLAIQSTSKGAMSAHVKKMRESPAMPVLVRAGWRVELWAWTKVGRSWQPIIRHFEIDTPHEEPDRSSA